MRWFRARTPQILAVTALVLLGACGDDGGTESTTTTAPTASVPTSAADSGDPTDDGDGDDGASEASTVTGDDGGPDATDAAPIERDGSVYTVTWEALVGEPFYATPTEGSDDPFFFVHTNPDVDGFYLGLELYTTGYGALWTGETGEVAVSCSEPAPGPNSTGVCVHFVPDVPDGPDLNADFAATGRIRIDRLDDSGYDIAILELVFSDGSSIAPFEMSG